MTSNVNTVQPPSAAVWLLGLFMVAEQQESILGDLLEEFVRYTASSGIDFGRRWYWRQALKTIVHLFGAAYRAAPWSISAAVGGGFLLRKLVAKLPEKAIFAAVDHYQIFEHHFKVYLFLASTGIDIGHLITFLLVGCVVALTAKGKEMAATMTLALIFGIMAVAGSAVAVTRSGDYSMLWRMSWYFADSFAIVIGGVFVRMRRSGEIRLTELA
jgi:hypothetical protein